MRRLTCVVIGLLLLSGVAPRPWRGRRMKLLALENSGQKTSAGTLPPRCLRSMTRRPHWGGLCLRSYVPTRQRFANIFRLVSKGPPPAQGRFWRAVHPSLW
jgi:hypothetical protein